jgi:hypothetical protein
VLSLFVLMYRSGTDSTRARSALGLEKYTVGALASG